MLTKSTWLRKGRQRLGSQEALDGKLKVERVTSKEFFL